jgi:phosphatidate cytidylyltransferase
MDEEGRKDRKGERGETTPEGVRILGAEEAAEALERKDVAHRRTGDQLRYGDRPPAPPSDGPRPVLRFPLGSSDDPRDIERSPVSSSEPPSGDEPSGQVELPHWTEPATGQVPAAVTGAAEDEPGSDDWASYASATPRWRDDATGYDDDDDAHLAPEDEERVGALDDSERPSHDDYLSFADLDQSVPPGRSVFADPDDDPLGEHDDTALGTWAPEAAADDDQLEAGWEPDDVGEAYEADDADGGAILPPSAPHDDHDDDLVAPPPRAPRRARREPDSHDGPPTGDRDMGMAVVVGVGLLAVALFLFNIGPAAAMILVTAVVGLAAAELLTALRQAGFQPIVLAGLAGSVGLVLGSYNYGTAAFPTVLFLTTAVCLLWYLVGAGTDSPAMNAGVTLLAVCWVGLFGSFAALMLSIGDPGIGILLAAILGTVAYDVGGLLVGRNAGRQPLSAASPNKTVEGLVGGCIIAVLVVVVGAVAVGFGPIDTLAEGLVVGLAVAFAAPLGDLCESLVKRDLGVKDMGSLLPGHGGLLDRFDALLFVLPTVYLIASVSDFFV